MKDSSVKDCSVKEPMQTRRSPTLASAGEDGKSMAAEGGGGGRMLGRKRRHEGSTEGKPQQAAQALQPSCRSATSSGSQAKRRSQPATSPSTRSPSDRKGPRVSPASGQKVRPCPSGTLALPDP